MKLDLPTPALLFALAAFVTHGVIYLIAVVGAWADPSRAQSRRAFANILAALSAAAVVALTAFELALDPVTRRSESLYFIAAMLLAIPVLIAVPIAANWLRRHARPGKSLIWLAGRPEWTLVIGVGALPVALGFSSFASWYLLAPLAVLPFIALETIILIRARASDGAQPEVQTFGPVNVARPVRPVNPAPVAPVSESLKVAQVVTAPGHCPVCREEVTSRVMFCTQCLTPQHAECFEFIGRCGIYGCGSQRARAVAATA